MLKYCFLKLSIRKYKSEKKRLLTGVLASILIVSLPAIAASRSLAEIMADRELRVCFSDIHSSLVSVTPLVCREDCRFSGPAFETVSAFADYLGDEIQVRGLRVDWDEQFFDAEGQTRREAEYVPQLLASGQCDIYPNNLAKTPWRLQKMDIVTLFPNRRIVLIKGEQKDQIQTLSDLAGKIAAVEKDTSYHTWLQEQNRRLFAENPLKIRLMTTENVLEQLHKGEADFTVIDADAAFWIIRHQFPNLYMAFPVGPTDEVGWGLRREDRDLQEAVKQFFDRQRESPDSPLNRIWNQYFGMDINGFIGLLGAIRE